jgi:thiosulfate dehydrogenase [quinone] large subunit
MTAHIDDRVARKRTNERERERERARSGRGLPHFGPGAALLPLRLFLGITFVYAGVQKLSDPGFLHPGAPSYIGTQLHGFAHGTPGGFLLRAFALPAPKLAGVGVALTEILVGVLVTAGLLTRAAAAVGLALNFVLFLTNSWNAYPYFLGSDIVFVFAWLPFVLTGSSGQPALDTAIGNVTARRAQPRSVRGVRQPALSRRDVVLRMFGLAGLTTLGIGGIAALSKGSYKSTRTLGLAAGKTSGRHAGAHSHPAASAHAHHRHHAASKRTALPNGARRLGSASQLPRGQAATYSDPTDGRPDIVIRGSDGKLAAFSAVCTHAGCTVGYSGGEIVCPCHGGTYSAKTGAVISGPPPSGLAPKRVIESGGDLYAVPS